MTEKLLTYAPQICAVLLAATRLLPKLEWLWTKLPPQFRWLPPVLIVALPQIADALGVAKSPLDLVEAVTLAIALLVPGARSATHAALAKQGPAVLLALFLAPSVTSCTPAMAQTVASVVSQVVSEVLLRSQQTNDVLDMIEAQVDAAEAHAPPDVVKKVRIGIAACRAANAAAVAASRGVELTAAQAQANFKPFREEWKRLTELLAEIGLASKDGRLMAAPGDVLVPEPLAALPFEGQ
jgi:hypothetical protein